ncbi:9394_t:CDS:1, partial [Scutellospora calospora]
MDRVPLSQNHLLNSKHSHFSPRFSPPTELHEEYYRKINCRYSPPLITYLSFNTVTNHSTFPIMYYQNAQTSRNTRSHSIARPLIPPYMSNSLLSIKISKLLYFKDARIIRKSLKNKLREDISSYKADLKSLSSEHDKISNCYVAIASLERMIKTKTPSNGFREGIYGMLKTLSTDPGENINLTNQIISTMLEIMIKIWNDKGLGRCAICKFGIVIESTTDDVDNLWL